MALPKSHPIKPSIPLNYPKTLLPRREEIKDMITKDGTYLPKSLLHADLDKGFLEFVKEKFNITSEGKKIPVVDIIITTQNWSQFVETWDFQNIDKNIEPPFLTIIRNPEVKYGNNPAVMYNIPNRRMYYYMEVPTWDGNRKGADIYKIPQPVPADFKYTVAIVCNRMREVNTLNQRVLETFASRQAYQVINGHYIPIINDGFADESVLDLEKRKYYIQKYDFTMMGFLIDENEFEVFPALSRTLQVFEVDQRTIKRKQKRQQPVELERIVFAYPNSATTQQINFEYTCNLYFEESKNVDVYSVFINDSYYGDDVTLIQVTTGDIIRIDIISGPTSETPQLVFTQKLI
jgi:hypothetical protein